MSMLPVQDAVSSGSVPSGADAVQRPPADRGALGCRLAAELREAQKARSLYESRWLENLRAYKGIYPPTVGEQLRRNRRSQVYYRITTAKVNTLVARLMDLLFPQRSKNWSICATPEPCLPPDVLAEDLGEEINALLRQELDALQQRMAAGRIVPDALAARKLREEAWRRALAACDTPENRQRVAAARAKRMESLIDDQLKECNANGQRRPSWAQNCRAVVHDACLYGMGVLKGPLVEKVSRTRHICRRDETGQYVWQEEAWGEELRPYHEAVSIWDVFPDPDARHAGELRYVWQCHLMTDKDVLALMSFPGFDAQAIRRHVRENEDGDAQLASWEAQLRELDRERSGGAALCRRYRVWERWGFLTGRELREAGAQAADEAGVYSANVWMMGEDTVIKAVVNPLEGVDIPYYWYPYQQDDSTFWPEGVASLLESPQAGINAAVRAMQDNAAMSSGPFLGINAQALSAEDAADMQAALARRVLRFDRAGVTLPQVFQAVNVPSCVSENLTAQQFWSNAADEISTPRFNAGDGNVSGAGKTASGLSMLMGASNILLKDHIKNFDDHIVAPFIRAMYRWNMQWSDREDCKGDFEVVASGSQSLIAKEVRAQQIPLITSWLGMPFFAPHIDARGLLEVAFEQTDLPVERILYTQEEAQRRRQDEQRAGEQLKVQALMQELQRQGMTPEQVRRQLVLLLAQLQTGQAGQAGAEGVQAGGEA